MNVVQKKLGWVVVPTIAVLWMPVNYHANRQLLQSEPSHASSPEQKELATVGFWCKRQTTLFQHEI